MPDTTRPRGRSTPPTSPKQQPAWARFPELPLPLWATLLQHARRHRGMNQTELAEACGVTQQSISKIESAEVCPHDKLKLKLAIALGVPTSDLFPWPER